MSEFQQTIFIGITTNDNSCYSNCNDEGVNEHYQHIQIVPNVSAKKKKQTKRKSHFIESNNQNNENICGLGAIVWSSNEQSINKLDLTTGTSFAVQKRIKL